MLRAVVRFARDVARLPSFPRVRETGDGDLHNDDDDEEDEGADEASVLKVVATDTVPGEVLPPSDTTWLALLPFQDLHGKRVTPELRAERVRTRRAFVELLVRLAASPQFGWDAATMQCGEMVGPPRSTNSTEDNAFWIGLLRALWPEAVLDATQPLERNLIALSRARRPRFLLCLDQDVGGAVDVVSLLESFLLPPDDDAPPVLYGHTIVDGLPDDDGDDDIEVEIGLSFTRGKISLATMTQLLDIIDRVHAHRGLSRFSPVRFRVTTLRFGSDCTFQAKALELLGHHRRRASNSVRSLRLGNLADVRASIRRLFFVDLLTRGHSHLRRLATATYDSFVPVASAVRSGGASRLQELDVKYVATSENAAWLAFAFFHADSKTSVVSLCLRAPKSSGDDHADAAALTREWLAAFERVLCSVRAERDLAHMEGPQQQQQTGVGMRTFVRLQPGVVAKSGPSRATKTVCTLDETVGEELELLVRYKSSVAIVIPGAGVGWVPSASVLSERVRPSRVGSTNNPTINHRVTSFTWDGAMAPCLATTTYYHLLVLMELLSIIGGPLRSLHLPSMRLRREHLAQILLYCPNLTELNVSGHELEDIDPLVEAYASGQCTISSLSIARSVHAPLREGCLTLPMVQILEGNGRDVLRRLVVHALPPCAPSAISQFVLERTVEPLAVVVSAPHSKIEYLHLPGLNLFASGALQRLHVDFSRQPLSFSRMPLRAKLAFLSAIYRFGTARSLGQLDASVLGVIFQFSYDCFARRILKNAPLRMDACACKTCTRPYQRPIG